MEQRLESDLVKRLEQLGIEVVVSPTGTTLTYEQIYISAPHLRRGFSHVSGRGFEQYEVLRTWKANTQS